MLNRLNRCVLFSLALMPVTMGFIPPAAGEVVNCARFKTQAAAQAYMVEYGATNLDGDRDGIACETLPSVDRSSTQPSRFDRQPSEIRRVPSSSLPSVADDALAYRVIRVMDGDTLRVSQGDDPSPIIVRLACIDAPEMRQGVYGPQATQRLKQLLPVGQLVNLQIHNTDRYGRQVAEVSQNGVNINVQMVAEGQAVVYSRYLSSCSQTTQAQLQPAEKLAQQNQLGFWQRAQPILPDVYRRNALAR